MPAELHAQYERPTFAQSAHTIRSVLSVSITSPVRSLVLLFVIVAAVGRLLRSARLKLHHTATPNVSTYSHILYQSYDPHLSLKIPHSPLFSSGAYRIQNLPVRPLLVKHTMSTVPAPNRLATLQRDILITVTALVVHGAGRGVDDG